VPSSPPETATGVSVTIVRDPALVRTVRLVAAAVARRAGRDEEFVEEVRLAVGEACALLIGDHTGDAASDHPVSVSMDIRDRLRVEVASDGAAVPEDPPFGELDDVEPWALLRGLIDDLEVVREGPATRLRMSWPLG
jgi:anti-sigma regulatory factor (Ser/Thr protein kinase)